MELKLKADWKFKTFKEKTHTFLKIKNFIFKFIETLKLNALFPMYLIGMMKLAWSTWRHKIKFRTEVPGQLMILHYNQKEIKDLSGVLKRIEERVVKPFRLLHKVNPVVLLLPFGISFQAGSFKGFVKSLDPDQLQALKKELYEVKILTPANNE